MVMNLSLITRIINIFIFVILLSGFIPMNQSLSPDSKWKSVYSLNENNYISFGLDSTDYFLHKYEIYYYFNNKYLFKEEYHTNSIRKYYQYRQPNSIHPTFSI